MQPAPVVTARVSVAEGSEVNLTGIRLTLHSMALQTSHDMRTDGAGRATLGPPVRPGRYTIAVEQGTLPEGYFVLETRVGRQEIGGEEFDVSTATQIDVVLGGRASSIRGLVVDGEGMAVPDVKVTLFPADERGVRVFFDGNGGFAVGVLRPGRYQIFAWEDADNSLWPDPEFRSRFAERAVTVEVGLGEVRKVEARMIGAEEMQAFLGLR